MILKRGLPRNSLPVENVGKGENRGEKLTRYHGRSWIPLLGKKHADGWDQVGSSHTFHEIQMVLPDACDP